MENPDCCPDLGNHSFSEDPVTRWCGNRNMELLEGFCYRDKKGKVWKAPEGTCINGATIPEALWSLVGSPYTGAYRRASIVHDVAVHEFSDCGSEQPPVEVAKDHGSRKDADRMFYHACRAGGCNRRFAFLLYLGVRIGSWMAFFSRSRPLMKSMSTEEPMLLREDKEIQTTYSLIKDVIIQQEEGLFAKSLVNEDDEEERMLELIDDQVELRMQGVD